MKQVHHLINQRRTFIKFTLGIMFAVIAMIISSCQKENLLSSSPNQDLISNSQKQDIVKKAVHFKAKFITADVITSPANLPDNPIQKDHITGTGEGTHIGKATIEAYIVSDLTTPFVIGNETITAANGDKIFMNNTGSVNGPDANNYIHATLNVTITGGTGKFAGAIGSLTGLVTQSLDTPAGTVSFEGTISY